MQYPMVDGLFGGWNLEGFVLGEIPNLLILCPPNASAPSPNLEYWNLENFGRLKSTFQTTRTELHLENFLIRLEIWGI